MEKGFRPRPGDLAIYDRSTPGKPETAWYGHVNRVTEIVDAQHYKDIGANQGTNGQWAVGTVRFDEPRLLGFISYPAAPASAEDVAHVEALVALTQDQAEPPPTA